MDGLVGYWTFNEKGNTAYDYSGNNNDGTIYGAVLTNGKSGGALNFDGVDDYVEINPDNSLDITTDKSISVEFWFKLPDSSEPGNIIVKDRELAIGMKNGKIWFRDNKGHGLTATIAFANNVWYHFVGVRDKNANKVRIYINGTLLKEGMEGTWNPTPTTRIMTVGHGSYPNKDGAKSFFKGSIDEIRIYNRALTPAEIQQNFEAGK